MASRTGVPADAWAIDHRAHLHAPAAAREAGVTQVVLLSGQVARVQRGKPFLVFGDGRLTACKPISDDDLAAYLVDCLAGPHRALLRYGATESMRVRHPDTGHCDAAATPCTGTQTLRDHCARLISGAAVAERGAHAVF